MTTLVDTVRTALGQTAAPDGALKQAEHKLITLVEKDSLGALIACATTSKDQGRIDAAIAGITKANRHQLDAIEGITRVLDTLFDRPRT